MLTTTDTDLGLTSTASAGCCGGASKASESAAASPAATDTGCCGGASKASEPVAAVVAGTITETFDVDGMTCAGCVTRVSNAVGEVAGAQSVSIDLVSGGVSKMTVSSTKPLDRSDVAAAVATTGYKLV
jgi:copper chaperone